MIDVEQRLRQEFERLAPAYRPLDWGEVLARADRDPRHRSHRWALVAVAAAAVAVIAFATPLGAAVAQGLGDFSSWLRGQPGTPAPTSEQQAFQKANERSWLHFPANTQLRQLASLVVPSTGQHVDLMGFRAGTTLCLRVIITGTGRAQTQSCVPVAELQQAGAPVRAVLVDHGFGKGTRHAWYGLDRLSAPAVQVTAGIAADGVRSVVLQDQAGKHTVQTSGNAFLYVATAPEVGQRVSHIWAKTARAIITAPFGPAPFGFGGGGIGGGTVPGPTHVQRHVTGGTIGWLDRHEPRGEPLSKVRGQNGALVRRHTVFGRVVVPDPSRPLGVALTLSTSRHGGKATGLCTWVVRSGGEVGGGCAVRAKLFATSPISGGITMFGGSDQVITQVGLASDAVARIVAFLSGGGKQAVPLRDNAYLVDIARSQLPARLVAYDKHGRIIALSQPLRDMNGGPAPARGKAHQLLSVRSATGATAQLLVGPSSNGGHCMYVRYHTAKNSGGDMIDCNPMLGATQLALSTDGRPTELVMGKVGPKVAHITLLFADNTKLIVTPTHGFVLTAIPPVHLVAGSDLVAAQALDASEHVIARESFRSTKHVKHG
jgi:hypothetical protein